MAQAIVQSSCRKLRSAIEDSAIRRLNLTGDLKEMLEVLLVIDAAIPNAKDWWMLTDWDRGVSTQDDRGREDDQERGEVWLITVKDVSYMVCDMVDDLQAKTTPAAGNKMAKMLARPDSVVVESKMFDKMKEIKEKLKGLRKESVRFVDAAGRRALLQAPPAIVGRDEDVRKILDRLSIFSQGPIILLIGGDKQIGKGAVAAAVFDNDRFKSYSRIWIDIKKTNNFGLYDIGRCMDSQLVSDGEEENRKKRLSELLDGKKVLVVLRKLHEDASKWKGLKDILTQTDINITQMIIIATVDTLSDDFLKVATGTFGIEPYHLEPLSEETCCKIIKQTALRSQDTTYKEELGRIAPKVVKLCRSVPMAAQILGSLLQFKQYREWPELLDLDAPSDRSPAHTSLELSYRSMPPNLRLCFSYCAFVFATQRDIVKDDLIHQWIALNLIEPSEAFSTSQLAEQYIRRLLDMSLLQTANSIRTSANDDVCPISFTMHASVVSFEISSTRKDFCLLEAGTTPRNTENCSYVSVPNLNFEGELKSIFPVQKIRVLRCLGCSKMKLRDDSFSFATYLCALELHWSYERKLPDSICQLRHLGYLKISGWSGLVTLPESIGNLTNLLHIDLSACSQLVNLPGSLGNLIKLVHISLSGCSKLANLPESFGNLIKLVHINLSGCGLIRLPECLSKLINLVHVNLSGCLALVKLPGSFVKLTKLEHINLSGCPKLVNLPESFGKLANLVHVNLSGCSGLVNLPSSFGKLTNLARINLSGCPELEELPESFGKLRSLLHINLSGCSGLATLPGSFGDLQNLLHINLSRCCGLLNLPRSFGKLKKLVHLDLSFWSCFEGIRTALAGLTSLEHLDLSHPCCGLADYHHFQGLKEVLSQFIRLRHLNLSMFLNPIFCNQPEKRNLKYIDFISGFSRLEYLDLSHSIFLSELPEGLDFLGKLHTLDLSACIRLKKVGEWMAHKPSLKLVVLSNLQSYQFIVGENNPINSYAQLVGVSCKALEISCLHMIKSAQEARILRLSERRDLQKLKLCWDMSSGRSVEDSFVLQQLVPPRSVMYLELHGYSSTCFPDWLTSSRTFSFNLVEVTMEDMPKCSDLPPLGLLPNLRSVSLKRMDSITRIDASELSGGNKAAFKQLSRFIIHDMGGLQEFTYYGCGGGRGRRSGGELLFPVIDELVVHNCPNMSFVPLPPRARRLVISDCNDVMVCWQNRAGRHGVHGPSCTSSPVIEVTELVVENCRVYLSHWCLLNHLPGLRSLTIKNCNNLVCPPEIVGILSSLQTLCFSNCHRMSILPEHLGGLSSLRKLRIKNCSQFFGLPDSMKCLTSLESLHFSDCNSMKALQPWIGSLTSLQQLAIERCTSIGDLPESIGELSNLKDLHILGCEDLKQWCGQEEGKKFLGDIRPNFEETATTDQLQENEEDVSDQSD